ncbi:MAG: peptide deformylase [Magnetococcales bacterium]|nr:peptide deformylase [Magnetococcales bacterium]
MAVLPILTAPDRRLKQKAQPVAEVNASVRQLMENMAETMYAAPGIGLAAPQVGISLRVICIDLEHAQEKQAKNPIFIANPVIVHAEGEICWKEGCLSIPDYTAEVNRASRVIVEGLGHDNRPLSLEGNDLLAVCLQHEIDHLNGKLFIDHISPLKRSIIVKKLKKQKEDP